eukprot:TRINITY_DN5776_c0_g1_i6.p1 TRINITY_DN5776_c0_g1~~TRINITY_DN5776_c0_g1_i6.p1  ORF type:complete len:239 (+),score=65.49 TRINITY_DN5776_c0_g1_i6:237-953(+)
MAADLIAEDRVWAQREEAAIVIQRRVRGIAARAFVRLQHRPTHHNTKGAGRRSQHRPQHRRQHRRHPNRNREIPMRKHLVADLDRVASECAATMSRQERMAQERALLKVVQREAQWKPVIKHLFDTIDKDGDGRLDRKEVLRIMKHMAKAMDAVYGADKVDVSSQVDSVFGQLDADEDGTISFDEIVSQASENGWLEAMNNAPESLFMAQVRTFEQVAVAVETGDWDQFTAIVHAHMG